MQNEDNYYYFEGNKLNNKLLKCYDILKNFITLSKTNNKWSVLITIKKNLYLSLIYLLIISMFYFVIYILFIPMIKYEYHEFNLFTITNINNNHNTLILKLYCFIYIFILFVISFIKTISTSHINKKTRTIDGESSLYNFFNDLMNKQCYSLLHTTTNETSFNSNSTNVSSVIVPISFRNYCRYCLQVKLPHTHHCRKCRKCVPKMDHHCPYLNTCIGELNKKFFILTLMYGDLLLLYTIYETSNSFIVFSIKDNISSNIRYHCLYYTMFLILVMFCGYFTAFTLYHISFVINGTTLFDSKFNPHLKSEDKRGIYSNISEVMGNNILLWLVPVINS